MAEVQLIDYTGKGRPDEKWHAANMLMFTKSTRLDLSPDLLERIQKMSEFEKQEELDYMSKTIPSSWEFVDVTFLVSGVSRAAAQQMTRTRNASFAMQSQRVTNVKDFGVVNPFERDGDAGFFFTFEAATQDAYEVYSNLVSRGCPLQDARGVLPMAAKSNLVAKYNLRSFVELMRTRSSLRVQGEYSDIADEMKSAVLRAWPWAATFFESPHQKAIDILEAVADEEGIEPGRGIGWDIAKAIDLLRK